MKPSVLIVGYGIVGRNMHKLIPWADDVDAVQAVEKEIKDAGFWVDPEKLYDHALICVQTPSLPDGSCDTQFVRKAVMGVQARNIIIKSAVPPGTADALTAETGKNIVVSPEYFGETHHANGVDQGFVIFGGDPQDTAAAAQLFQYVYTGAVKFFFVDAKTAELVKYMENTYLATKVVFCNEFYRIARAIGVEYGALRELFVADSRVNPSHTFVYESAPFFDSKCLNKDVPAIVNFAKSVGVYPTMLEAGRQRNAEFKVGE